MLKKISEAISKKLKENNIIDYEQYDICRYGLQQCLSIILNIVSILVIGIAFNLLWQAILFIVLYIPLRSNAGGYHAKTAVRCYIYSIILMIAVLLVIKYIKVSNFICIITVLLSAFVLCIFAPVEDLNKPLDKKEQIIYQKRTQVITLFEIILLVISMILKLFQVVYSVNTVLVVASLMLLIGKYKIRIIEKNSFK